MSTGTTWAYMRTSTDGQDGQGQRQDILEWSASQGERIDHWVSEQISSRVQRQHREVSEVVASLKAGDRIVVSEMSRIARSMTELMTVVQEIKERRAELIAVRDGVTIKADDGWQTSAYLMAVSIGAEIEREMISQRTKSALQARRAMGVKLGRPAGKSKLDAKAEEIDKYRELGISTSNIAKLVGCNRGTLYAWMERTGRHGRGKTKQGSPR